MQTGEDEERRGGKGAVSRIVVCGINDSSNEYN